MKRLLSKLPSLKTPQGFFFWVTLVFGGVFLLIVPPFQTPDEAAHFLRSYQIASGDFVPQQKDGVIGSYLPTSLQKTEAVVDGSQPLQTQPHVKYQLGHTKAAFLTVSLNEDEKGFVNTTVTASYSPVGYVPQVAAMLVGRILHSPPILMLYLAKLFVLAAWIGLVFVSIKVFPFKKWAVAGIAVLPMFIAQSVSMGVDVLAVGAGLLFTSIIVRAIYERSPIGTKTIILLMVAGIIMVMSKQIMALLLPLVIALPLAAQLGRVKGWLLKALLVVVPLLLFVGWTAILPDINQSITQIQNQQNTTQQVAAVASEPWVFARALLATFFLAGAPGDGVLHSLIGNFGWVDTPLAEVFIVIGYIMLAGYLLIHYEKKSKAISRKHRLLFLAVTLLYFVGVCGAMYVLFSPVGSPLIAGIQGRYLFPCLFLLLPVLLSSVLIMKEKQFVMAAKIASVGLLGISAVTIVLRYYIDAL